MKKPRNSPRNSLSLIAALLVSGAAAAGTIEVRVSGVEGSKGSVHVAVCDKEQFLKQCKHNASAPARAGETVVTVSGVPAGTWAVLSYQDENQNGQLDRNLIGIPKENYGFSKDARGSFGPPSFEQAAIPVTDDAAVVPVKLR